MISFINDYSFGAHEKVLEALRVINGEAFPGYSEDGLHARAQDWLRGQLRMPQLALHFLSGGTQANLAMISSVLRPHQGVIAADTGHIASHETGAIEATGHKVLTVMNRQGKLCPGDVRRMVAAHYADESFEHLVQPGMAYISNTTELGTVYSRAELEALSLLLKEKGLPLYLDGARLGYALHSEGNDLSLEDVARCCDAFTIGMTKQGTLFGEALVIVNPALQEDFRYIIKQKGGMLAKGWLMAAQFEALVMSGLYGELAGRAVALAMRLKEGIRGLGYAFASESSSNQQFPILPDKLIAKLKQDFTFHTLEQMEGGMSMVRFVTSWASREEEVEALLAVLKQGA